MEHEDQMKIADEIMRDNQDVLKKLKKDQFDELLEDLLIEKASVLKSLSKK